VMTRLADGFEGRCDVVRKVTAMLGFLALALSPSFEDWEQSPEKRGQFLAYYATAMALIWLGLDGWMQ